MITVFNKLPDISFTGLIEVAMAYRERLSQTFMDEWDRRSEHITIAFNPDDESTLLRRC